MIISIHLGLKMTWSVFSISFVVLERPALMIELSFCTCTYQEIIVGAPQTNDGNSHHDESKKPPSGGCSSCSCPIIDDQFYEAFTVQVCRECKFKDDFKLLSKTKLMGQFLVSEKDLNGLSVFLFNAYLSSFFSHTESLLLPSRLFFSL
jgi:hypothetical protein